MNDVIERYSSHKVFKLNQKVEYSGDIYICVDAVKQEFKLLTPKERPIKIKFPEIEVIQTDSDTTNIEESLMYVITLLSFIVIAVIGTIHIYVGDQSPFNSKILYIITISMLYISIFNMYVLHKPKLKKIK